MKVAIHKSNWGFSKDWIAYCIQHNVAYKIVNCYETDIVEQLRDCDVLLWHHHHTLAKDKLFAQQLLFALQQSGMRVFPDFNTGWHFDDKLGQKYLLEAIGAPLVPTEVFYDKAEAKQWAKNATFPKVFKLRGGAGSTNVKLVHSEIAAKRLINRAFGKGFPSYDRIGDLKEVWRKYRTKKTSFKNVLKSFRRLIMSTEFGKVHGRENGYVLFQEFIPNNQFDIRIVTIGDKAFGIKRMVRANDFRASGSGYKKYNRSEFDERCVELAFQVTEKMEAQCVAYDFVFDENNNPLIVEISYGFHDGYLNCPGYWDSDLNWHAKKFNAAHFIIDLLIQEKK